MGISILNKEKRKTEKETKQESIPVGCVPPASLADRGGEVSKRGVSQVVCPGGMSKGVCLEGASTHPPSRPRDRHSTGRRGRHPPEAEADLPPANRMTDRCKKQTSFAGGKKALFACY